YSLQLYSSAEKSYHAWAARPCLQIRDDQIHKRRMTLSDKIRLGIVGCGGTARSRHITGLTELKNAGIDNFEVTACCDVVDDNVQAVAAHARERQGAHPEIY